MRMKKRKGPRIEYNIFKFFHSESRFPVISLRYNWKGVGTGPVSSGLQFICG